MNKRTSVLSVIVAGAIAFLLPVAGLGDFASAERANGQTAALISGYLAPPYSTLAPPSASRQSWNSEGAKGTPVHAIGGGLPSPPAMDCGPQRSAVELRYRSR